MSTRNLSPQVMFEQMAHVHVPLFHFEGKNATEFEKWKAEAWPQVLATLGNFPVDVDPNPELLAEWDHDGLHKQRWIIDVGPFISATFLVNYPDDFAQGEKRPALLCWHGHGAFGKEPVMGAGLESPEMAESSVGHNYGHEMAKQGYITFAIDWIGSGERSGSNKPHHRKAQDWCNMYYLHATMFGMTSLSINIAHGCAATSFATSLPGVDGDNVGVVGSSGGGTMALWSALCDERIKATEIISYSDLWEAFGIRDINYCGMQVAPGLYKLVDLPDLQGLLAPRPLLIDIGAYDTCFIVDTAMRCYKQVQDIYAAAGACEHIDIDFYPGAHGWGNNKSREFFGKYLNHKAN